MQKKRRNTTLRYAPTFQHSEKSIWWKPRCPPPPSTLSRIITDTHFRCILPTHHPSSSSSSSTKPKVEPLSSFYPFQERIPLFCSNDERTSTAIYRRCIKSYTEPLNGCLPCHHPATSFSQLCDPSPPESFLDLPISSFEIFQRRKKSLIFSCHKQTIINLDALSLPPILFLSCDF